jgi:hypothetical protein
MRMDTLKLLALSVSLGCAVGCQPKQPPETISQPMSAHPAPKTVDSPYDHRSWPGSPQSTPNASSTAAPSPAPPPGAVPDPIDLNFKKGE